MKAAERNDCSPQTSLGLRWLKILIYRAPSQAGRGIGRCWGWPPPRGAWGCPPLWASGKWPVCRRWDSTAGPPGERSSPSGSWSIPWRERWKCIIRREKYNPECAMFVPFTSLFGHINLPCEWNEQWALVLIYMLFHSIHKLIVRLVWCAQPPWTCFL